MALIVQNDSSYQNGKLEGYPHLADMFSLSYVKDILKLLNVEQEDEALIKVVDVEYAPNSDGKPVLVLLHYSFPKEEVNHVRGVILDVLKEPRIVCKSFPYTPEYNMEFLTKELDSESFEIVEKVLQDESTVVYPVIEGTTVRVFYHDSRWYFSTNKKMNSLQSKWCNAVFSELFFNTWFSKLDDAKVQLTEKFDPNNSDHVKKMNESFDEFLSRELCYVFILISKENRIVSKCDKTRIFLISSYDTSSNKRNDCPRIRNGNVSYLPIINIKSVERCVHLANTSLSSLSIVSEGNVDNSFCGYTVFNGDRILKLYTGRYVRKLALRNGEPSIRYRYIHLLKEAGYFAKFFNTKPSVLVEDTAAIADLASFRELFSDEKLDDIDKRLKELPSKLVKLYNLRFSNRGQVIFSPPVHYVIMETFKSFSSKTLQKLSVRDRLAHFLEKKDARSINMILKYVNSKHGNEQANMDPSESKSPN